MGIQEQSLEVLDNLDDDPDDWWTVGADTLLDEALLVVLYPRSLLTQGGYNSTCCGEFKLMQNNLTSIIVCC